jgi:hypothetical protein
VDAATQLAQSTGALALPSTPTASDQAGSSLFKDLLSGLDVAKQISGTASDIASNIRSVTKGKSSTNDNTVTDSPVSGAQETNAGQEASTASTGFLTKATLAVGLPNTPVGKGILIGGSVLLLVGGIWGVRQALK